MSGESKGSSIIDQFSEAIQSVKDRITGYNRQVSEYKQGVNANADKLRELVERLKQCLEGLRSLKQNHEGFVTKLQSIYQNIDTERSRALEDNQSDADEKCNQKIQSIYSQFKELETTLSEMDTDFSNTISDQLTALGGVIDELCKEGDGLSSQISSSSQNVGTEIEKLESKFSSGSDSAAPSAEAAAPSTGSYEGRTVYINSMPSDTWKSSGEPPDEYYYRADGQSFNDGTGMVESSYTHPKDYPMQGGWLDVRKLKSLSKTYPIRSLRKKTKKKKKNFLKSSKKRKNKKNKKTKKRRQKRRKRKTKKR
tara:strand:+ start:1096 stop:2025 length:930 start_codon:yes stop_codon:yes gene_type:complete